MITKNIKYTYKRKDNNTFHSLNNKRIRILNETGNEILKLNENNDENVQNQNLNDKKKNLNDISSYFNKKIPKHNEKSIIEEKINPPIMKNKKTLEFYFQKKPDKESDNENSNTKKEINMSKN